ncbi:hypothetical protein [Streptomyces sp. E-08]|uniref:hypothetical protein n=1 Tax=Streptomyces sp. E-08 TaxID=3404047 RepID=UPI003CF09F13
MYQKAINEELKSTTTGDGFLEFRLNNSLAFPVAVYLISDDGWWVGAVDSSFIMPGLPGIVVRSSAVVPVNNYIDKGWYFLFLNAYSGAFVAALQADEAFRVPGGGYYVLTLNPTHLLEPNDLGSVPKPSKDIVIPTDSPRVVVACGMLGTGNVAVREQYWQRLPDSYSISKGAKRTVDYTVTSGMERTTSEQSRLGSSVMGSASVGWGPISATLSASLSVNSTTFQQVSTNVETTAFVSQTYDNTAGKKSRICFYWQLTNVLTVFDGAGVAQSSLVYGAESPAVIDAHDLAALPPRPVRKPRPMSADMRARLPEPPPSLRGDEVRQRSAW